MKKIKLPKVCNITTGKLDANAAESDGIYPFFTCGEFPERINTFAFDDDVIILAGNNAQGNFHIQRYTGKFNAYQRTYVITAREGYNIDYIKYSIELSLNHLKKIAQGSQTKFLTMPILNDFELEDLTLEEQNKLIAGIVAIDKKIEINNAINNNLLQTINTIYEYWFYQFEFPNNENKPYKSNNGNLIWNKELKRNIPADWKVQNFYNNELYKLISSGIDKFKVKTYLATADVNDISINNGSIINFETRESRANMQPVLYSVWFAKMKNSVKHLFLNKEMNKIIDNYILSTGFYGFQCSENSFEYVSSIISSTHFENLKDLLSHGATQQGITDDDLKNMKLLVPNIDVLNKFHNATKGLYSQLSHNLIENKRLVELRNYLLPLLMNGQATIDE